MISGDRFPKQRYVTDLATMRRECLLPGDVSGDVLVKENERVDSNTIVARGNLPARHHILDADEILGLRNPEDLMLLMLVSKGDNVKEGQVLAGRNPKRGKRVFSPIHGIVASVEDGQIIVRERQERLELEAGMSGLVVETRAGRGAIIETTGAVLQGVWGNSGRGIGTLYMEPSRGIVTIDANAIDMQWRGAVVVSQRPITPLVLRIIEAQNISGVIAPSMDANLMEAAKQTRRAILLTEGFGDMRMSNTALNFLEGFVEYQATVDAVTPSSLVARRPEVLINVANRGQQPPSRLGKLRQLKRGMTVRIAAAPHAGLTGKVVEILDKPTLLENGLQVNCAKIEFPGGSTDLVPLANIEMFTL